MKAELKRLSPLPEEMLNDSRYEMLAPAMSNVDLFNNYEVDEVVKRMYDQIPKAALHVVELLVITGMCRSMRRMQLTVFSETGEMLDKEVIKYHLSLNKPKLERSRDEFSEKQRMAMWVQLMKLAEEPNAVRYQKLATDLTIIAEKEIGAHAEANHFVGGKELCGLIDGVKKIMEIDPLYSRGTMRRDKETRKEVDREHAANKVDAVMSRLADYERTKDDDADYTDLQSYTQEIIERGGGMEYDAGQSEDCGTGGKGQEHEEGEGSRSESA